jgi:hypothetical protein
LQDWAERAQQGQTKKPQTKTHPPDDQTLVILRFNKKKQQTQNEANAHRRQTTLPENSKLVFPQFWSTCNDDQQAEASTTQNRSISQCPFV